MTTDQQIADDLAIVARTSRARPLAIETSLARATADTRGQRVPSGFAATYIHATHVARMSAGIAAAVSVAALIVFLGFGHDDSMGMLDSLAHMPKFWTALCVLGVVSTTHVVAGRIAMSMTARDPATLANRSIAASIAGAMMIIVLFGMAAVHGGEGVVALLFIPNAMALAVCPLIGTVIVCVVVARTGIGPRRWMMPIGLALLVGTIAIGLVTGPLASNEFPPISIRAAITATGTSALFLIVTSIVLAIHRRDDQAD